MVGSQRARSQLHAVADRWLGLPRLVGEDPVQLFDSGRGQLGQLVVGGAGLTQERRDVVGRTAGQHDRQILCPARRLVPVELVADQGRFELHSAALGSRRPPLGPPAVLRRRDHQDEPGLADLLHHPQRPVLRALAGGQVELGVHTHLAQQDPQVTDLVLEPGALVREGQEDTHRPGVFLRIHKNLQPPRPSPEHFTPADAPTTSRKAVVNTTGVTFVWTLLRYAG
ncbi:hypothetical protein Adu01nite_22310 [Paractinoplanes durhamensis]|uniref:Uncharacterized protein n=1 Tax=Paractinoplanes durhamensis TaxID=113563 RepID=A0ABQ3YTG9_9ACTN|nr:hypothetical protein Adu01nite_22310 [Actinoplanes durhamensis]